MFNMKEKEVILKISPTYYLRWRGEVNTDKVLKIAAERAA